MKQEDLNREINTILGKFSRKRFEEFKKIYEKNKEQTFFVFEKTVYNTKFVKNFLVFLSKIFSK